MHSHFRLFSSVETNFSKNREKELRRAKVLGVIVGKYPHKWFYMGAADTGYSFDDVLQCSQCGKKVIVHSLKDYPSYKWCDKGKTNG